jgi:hypothetical protein
MYCTIVFHPEIVVLPRGSEYPGCQEWPMACFRMVILGHVR